MLCGGGGEGAGGDGSGDGVTEGGGLYAFLTGSRSVSFPRSKALGLAGVSGNTTEVMGFHLAEYNSENSSLHICSPVYLKKVILLSTLIRGWVELVIKTRPLGAHSHSTVHSERVNLKGLLDDWSKNSNSPAKLPNPPKAINRP